MAQNWLDALIVGMSIIDITSNTFPSWLVRIAGCDRIERHDSNFMKLS